MKREAELGPLLLNQVQYTIAEKKGTSHSSVQSLLKEKTCNVTDGKPFSIMQKK
jgi:hypothetical protein